MKYDVKAFELLSNEEIADGIFDMRVKNDELAPLAKCGQFAHVYVPSKNSAQTYFGVRQRKRRTPPCLSG